jgi:hypothetical protein
MKPPLHRESKQHDAEALALALINCCAFQNSALTEDGICCGANEFYYRVAEQYVKIDGLEEGNAKQYIEALEQTAKVLDTLAEQFRTFAENVRQEEGITSHIWPDKAEAKEEDDDDERQDATKA